MAFVHGKNTAVLYKAADLTSYFNDSSTSEAIETSETTTYQPTGAHKTYIVGHADGTVSLSGLFDGEVGAVDEVLTAALATDGNHPLLVASEGLTIGKACKVALGHQTSYEVTSPLGDVVATAAEFQCTGGLDRAVVLHALTAESATTNSTSVDNAASTANGGVAVLHVVANSRNGSTTIKVQHSADNSTWADLVTFTAVSSSTTTSERVLVAAGTTVNRYIRAQSTLSGSTGTISYAVAFGRR